MSEYWKSTPKYWCKHCSTYVKDTPFERRQHESTAKHQNNLKRFLREIQNEHERKEHETQRAKAEVERLNRVVGSGGGASTASTASTPQAPTVRKTHTGPPSAADQKRQWAQLAEMGIKVPDEVRAEMAMAGDWQVVSQRTVDDPSAAEPLSIGVRKRKYEGQEEEEEEKKEAGETVARRGWGAAMKRYPREDTSDLDALLAGTMALKREKHEMTDRVVKHEDHERAGGLLHEKACDTGGEATTERPSDSHIKPVGAEGDAGTEDQLNQVKAETTDVENPPSLSTIPGTPPMPVFKKRRAKARATGLLRSAEGDNDGVLG